MSSFSPWSTFARRCTKPKKGLVIGIVNSHELVWAKWIATVIVFHSKGQSFTVLPFSCFFFYEKKSMASRSLLGFPFCSTQTSFESSLTWSKKTLPCRHFGEWWPLDFWPLVWRVKRQNTWSLANWLVEINSLSTLGHSVKQPLRVEMWLFIRKERCDFLLAFVKARGIIVGALFHLHYIECCI